MAEGGLVVRFDAGKLLQRCYAVAVDETAIPEGMRTITIEIES